MASVLETIVFDIAKFQQELQAFDDFLKSKADLSERDDIQLFFQKNMHLTAYIGTFAPSIAVTTFRYSLGRSLWLGMNGGSRSRIADRMK